MHLIHARQLARAPWGWRDAVVTTVAEGWVSALYVETDVAVVAWHHERVPELRAGTPIRVHEASGALGGPFGWLNVAVLNGGLGPVPEPADPSVWEDKKVVEAVNLSTGVGIAVDHVDPDWGPEPKGAEPSGEAPPESSSDGEGGQTDEPQQRSGPFCYVPCPRRGTHLKLIECWACWCDVMRGAVAAELVLRPGLRNDDHRPGLED